ncbi:MAG: methyltransferase [Anaerolineales bacterium]
MGEKEIITSLDLGLSQTSLILSEEGVIIPGKPGILSWQQLELIQQDETCCYRFENDGIQPIRIFSEESGRVYSLMPTQRAPTLLISGIPMHRFKDIDPIQDTHRKIKACGGIAGRVLDTATGLGYTAIQASQRAIHVVTIERDVAVLEIAKQNPWSAKLFHNPQITQIIGDSFEEIARFPAGEFRLIIHDPPAFSLAGELYSAEFYRQALRALNQKGRMFHYIGDPASKMGAGVTRGVMRRLKEAGFSRVIHQPQAFGVLAIK